MRNYIVRRNGRTNDFFGDMLDDFFKPVFYDEKADGMKTDIKETETKYEMEVEMAGFDKKDIAVSFNDGYITVSASKEEKDEGEKDGKKYLRRERSCSCSRSYYVGEVDEKEIKAKYENGVLSIDIPKEQPKQIETHTISID
ncbi:MAG: hypothetical protein DBX59_04465 [Bacillota bacterium]|nr:MAG: hypothetical protein DBX59_04465 [Bacillota bacterium]